MLLISFYLFNISSCVEGLGEQIRKHMHTYFILTKACFLIKHWYVSHQSVPFICRTYITKEYRVHQTWYIPYFINIPITKLILSFQI